MVGFVIQTRNVYCEVLTVSLNKTDYVSTTNVGYEAYNLQ